VEGFYHKAPPQTPAEIDLKAPFLNPGEVSIDREKKLASATISLYQTVEQLVKRSDAQERQINELINQGRHLSRQWRLVSIGVR
jgi:hypothetical protein